MAFSIAKVTPTITWGTPAPITQGTALSSTQLNATASVAGSFAYNPPAGSVPAAGTQTLSATFTPTDTTDYTSATRTVQIVVTPGVTQVGTTTTLVASATTINYNQTLTLTATVAANSGPTPSTGSVQFADGATVLGTVAVNASGTAVLTNNSLALGTHTITATYLGNSSFLTSTSAGKSVLVSLTAIASAYILDTSAAAALTVSGNAHFSLAGLVDVNSSSSTAIAASGNAIVSGSTVQVHGGVQTSGNAHISPAPVTYAGSFTDPLLGLAAPSTSGMTNFGAVNVSGNSSTTINPGIFTSITVSGNGRLTMNPGVYLITGGGFSISGNGGVNGAGVMIYNAGSNFPGTGGTFGNVTLSGNGNISLTPASTGTYAGILIFQSRDNNKVLTLSGNGMVMPGGLIYAPAAALAMSGNGQFKGSIVVDTVNISGNSILNQVTGDGQTVYTPAEIRTAYGVNNLILDGTGQTIAIIGAYDNPTIFQALDRFDLQFGATATGSTLFQQYGPASGFVSIINQQGQSNNLPSVDPTGAGQANWEMEAALDAEWVHAIAPGAKIVLVEANSQSLADLMTSVRTAASQPGVSVVSMSWGMAERQMVSAQDEALYNTYLTTPAGHQGVTFVASTGDYGTGNPEYPAFSSNVVAVGGTSLSVNADGSYAGESAWGTGNYAGTGQLVGSGGGVSQFEKEPVYQQAVQSTGFRTSPDVSMVADPSTGAWIADPYNFSSDNPWAVVGGTSLSAPSWAGLIILANQGRADAGKATLNSTGPTETQQALYNLPLDAFHDVTTGTNGGYNAGVGYDLVSGLGTPAADILIPGLVASNGGGPIATQRTITVTAADVNLNSNVDDASTVHGEANVTIFNAQLVATPGRELRSGATSQPTKANQLIGPTYQSSANNTLPAFVSPAGLRASGSAASSGHVGSESSAAGASFGKLFGENTRSKDLDPSVRPAAADSTAATVKNLLNVEANEGNIGADARQLSLSAFAQANTAPPASAASELAFASILVRAGDAAWLNGANQASGGPSPDRIDSRDDVLIGGEGDDLQISSGKDVLVGGFATTTVTHAAAEVASSENAGDINGLAIEAFMGGE